MASSGSLSSMNSNIPDYEYKDVNTKPFLIGSFRNLWLDRLRPSNYAYQAEDEDKFDTDFAKEMGLATETMDELKAICRLEDLSSHRTKVS